MDAAAMLVRLQDVAFPLLLASAEWCPFDQEPTYGFLLNDSQAPQDGGGEDSGRRVAVSYVHPRSPAASAGLQLGDQVLEVNTRSVADSTAEDVMWLARKLTRARIQPLQLEILRAGRRHRAHMVAVPACQFSLQLIQTDQINGVSNGRQVGVTTGMMRFFPSDDELAWVLAHEIAHNVLSHVQNARLHMMLNAFQNAMIGDSVVRSMPVGPRSLEAQADYVGAYIMARSGYDLKAVRRVWRRLQNVESQQTSPNHAMVMTHPTTAERLAAFEVTVKEIEEKRGRGELLEPVSGTIQ